MFDGIGELPGLMAAMEWGKTLLGPEQDWPQSLRSALSICVGSRFPIAIYWGPQLALLYNDAWSPILGAKHPWALGRAAKDVWPEIWDAIEPLFQQVMTKGESTYSEDSLLLMHRHGYTEECYFNFTFTPIRDERGHVGGVFNAVIETTYRVISERRSGVLRELSERVVAARSADEVCQLAAASLARAQHDVPFCALYLVEDASRARLAGCAGLTAGSSAAPEHLPFNGPAVWPFDVARATGKILTVKDLHERNLPGGAWPEPPREALIVPIVTGGGGPPAGFLVLGASPRRAVDDEYKQFAERVASHVAMALSSATAYEQERKRAEALTELDKAKTLFFSNVSHEFRTPLTLMLGPTEDLLSGTHGALAEGQRPQLELLHRNAVRLQKLVNNLLDFSRIEAGRFQAVYAPVELAELTRDLASVFRSAVERAGLTLTVDCPPLAEPVYVDRDLWEKVVLNLLSNALKFTFEGGIEVSLRSVEDSVVLRVKDTGVGVPAAEVPRLFERFHRVEGTRARTHEGSGIGLALVQELTKMHGGEIRAESQLGVGTTFTVTLPKGAAHLPEERLGVAGDAARVKGAEAFVEEALRWSPQRADAVAQPSGAARERVLLADDNTDMREYVQRLLEPHWAVEAVADGEAALLSARAHPPDVILTDVMMPKLDGFGLLRALRSDALTRGIPVVLLSARAGEESTLEGLEAGADDYLVKPFSARELCARVRTQLEIARLRRGAEAERDQLRTLLKGVPATINFLRGPELIFDFVHPRAMEALGRRDLLGRALLEALPEHRDLPYVQLLKDVFRTGAPITGNEVLVKFDRKGTGAVEDTYWNFAYLPVRSLGGHIDGVMTFDVEVTDQVLSRHKLEEEHQKAEAAVRVRDDFLSVASHELRTPLTTLSLQTDSVLRVLRSKGAVDLPQILARVETVRRSADRLEQLVEGLLDVSRIAAGRMELQLEEVDLAVLGREICERFEDEARRSGSSIHFSADPPLVGRWDSSRLDQVLTNLLSNALKYGQGHAIHVTLEATPETARLRVRDQGIGIAAEHQERIFMRFERAVSDRHFGGLGLGLWITRQLVEAMGGKVTVESQLAQGATFTVELPRRT